ncbi:hypothetical protein SPI_02964 [Niveomyces insectorum RCEF 264]|uniref:DUF8021 domain-containing protein n=1 Tax=Niveomyces insectorum RCEF 264 TaxID=1081102 RepID=A0A167WY69_9HYPO|nr:hypothetical protein SPI_02964 [Niveomyces insectorum RCEF 264]
MHRVSLAYLATAALAPTAGVLAAPVRGAWSAAAINCTREFLKANTDTYIAAQTAGKPAGVLALAGIHGSNNSSSSSSSNGTHIDYAEDAIARDPATGVLALPLAIVHNSSLLDTTQCATYTELIVTDPAHPRVIGTQMRFSAADGGRLTKMESFVTQTGDWAFNASGTLHYAEAETGKWGTIPAADRDSRATIQAAADAYLDLFNNKSVVVPWGTPCDRLEGSMYTGNGSATDSCDVGVPSGVRIFNRRYVIDETVGAVDAMVTFVTRPDSHEFRIEKGKIRFVHTLTVMRNLTEEAEVAAASLKTAHTRRTKRSRWLW